MHANTQAFVCILKASLESERKQIEGIDKCKCLSLQRSFPIQYIYRDLKRLFKYHGIYLMPT